MFFVDVCNRLCACRAAPYIHSGPTTVREDYPCYQNCNGRTFSSNVIFSPIAFSTCRSPCTGGCDAGGFALSACSTRLVRSSNFCLMRSLYPIYQRTKKVRYQYVKAERKPGDVINKFLKEKNRVSTVTHCIYGLFKI